MEFADGMVHTRRVRVRTVHKHYSNILQAHPHVLPTEEIKQNVLSLSYLMD
jgi:hypothetical protein